MEALVNKLIKRAADAADPSDAMKLSQAAANSANALCALKAALSKPPEGHGG